MLSRRERLAALLSALAEGEAAALSLPLLDPGERQRLLAAARRLPYRRARELVGEGERAVRQDFALATAIPPNGSIARLGRRLEALMRDALASLPRPLLPETLRLNDVIAQRYEAGSSGISAHRDHLRYRGLVLLITLSGSAPLYCCSDRSGRDPQAVDAAPGRLVVLRAPGFAGRKERPFHFLGPVERRRFSLGFRYDSLKP